MDDATFGLNECQRVFFGAGIRHILRLPEPHVSREMFQPVSQEDLPVPLQVLLRKNAPGSATLWTYAELGLDLMGKGSSERSKYLKKLIQLLGWSKGSICFWPYTLIEGDVSRPRPEYFMYGLQELKPKSIVVFGKQPLHDMLLFHEPLKSYVEENPLPFLWLNDLSILDQNCIIDQNTVDALQTLKNSL